MSDLPRFTGGSVGPITHAQMNEMMRRLDAIQPLIESASVSEEHVRPKKNTAFLVYAKRATDAQYAGRFEWQEIAVLPKDRDNETERVAGFADEDWDEIETEVVLRGGGFEDDKGNELDTYAIAATTSVFLEGFALCFVKKTIDGTLRHVLIPLEEEVGEPSVRYPSLWIIEQVLGDASVPITGGSGGSVTAYVYVCRGLEPNTSSQGAGPSLIATDEVIPFYDFGPANENKPVVPEGTELTAVPLKVGTVFRGFAKEVGIDEVYGFMALPPRFDVECL